MTIPAEVLNALQKNGMVWEIEPACCEECGREGVRVNILFPASDTRITVSNLDNFKTAVDFVSDLKRAGIVVRGSSL
jgi:predicted Zn-ribbon and HTH transcriptional regulator